MSRWIMPALVGVRQTGADLVTEPGELLARQPSPPVYKTLEVSSRDVLHHDIGGLPTVELGFSCVVDLHNVRVCETRRGTSFTLEAVTDVRTSMDGVEQLHGHGTIQYLITSQKDAGHASRA